MSNFRQTPWIGMLKTFFKVKNHCPVVFHEEIIAVLWMKNVSNWHRKSQKTQNFPIFKVLKHFLLKFRQTSWIGMFERVKKGKGWLSSSLLKNINAGFKLKNVPNWHRKCQKTNFSNFQSFYAFLLKFRQTSWVGMFKRINKGKGWLSISLLGKDNWTFSIEKCLELTTKMTKCLEFSNF